MFTVSGWGRVSRVKAGPNDFTQQRGRSAPCPPYRPLSTKSTATDASILEQAAFETAGVQFIPDGTPSLSGSPGLRLKD
jgi:hypothetical protein